MIKVMPFAAGGLHVKVPLLDLQAQYATIRDEVRAAIDEVCESQRFILGPRVESFEKHVAEYCGTGHAIGVSSGTDALLVALMAMGVGPGDAVLTTPYTFFATAGCIARLGATPVFADIDPATFNIDAAQVERVLGEWPLPRFQGLRLKAMVPVHLFGQSADMDPLLALARRHGLKVVEDACQAIGAEYPSAGGCRRVGSMGAAGCFSFFPSKNLGGFGDGGMVTTNDAALAERLRQFRNHGMEPKYHHKAIGGNFRLDALQAAVLDIKLKHLESWHAGRRANAARYEAALRGAAVSRPAAAYAGRGVRNDHIYNQYVVRMARRDETRRALEAAGVGCEVYYPVPLHRQECFASLGYREGDFPASEAAARESLALPVYPEMTVDMVAHVAGTIVGAAGTR